MDQKHTPLPWMVQPHISDNGHQRAIVVRAPGGYGNAITGWGSVTQTPADAEFIVRACNAHYKLVAALEMLLENIEEHRGIHGINFDGESAAHEALTAAGAA